MQRAMKLLPGDMRALLDTLTDALAETHDGDLEPRVASALAVLAGAILRVYQTGELALRMQALEEHLNNAPPPPDAPEAQ